MGLLFGALFGTALYVDVAGITTPGTITEKRETIRHILTGSWVRDQTLLVRYQPHDKTLTQLSDIKTNQAPYDRLHVGTLTLTNSTVSGNTAANGGGIFTSGTATLNNSVVCNNTASVIGGGVFNNGTVTLNSSTIDGRTDAAPEQAREHRNRWPMITDTFSTCGWVRCREDGVGFAICLHTCS